MQKMKKRIEYDSSVTKTEFLFISLHLTTLNFPYHFLNSFFSKIDLSKLIL